MCVVQKSNYLTNSFYSNSLLKGGAIVLLFYDAVMQFVLRSSAPSAHLILIHWLAAC